MWIVPRGRAPGLNMYMKSTVSVKAVEQLGPKWAQQKCTYLRRQKKVRTSIGRKGTYLNCGKKVRTRTGRKIYVPELAEKGTYLPRQKVTYHQRWKTECASNGRKGTCYVMREGVSFTINIAVAICIHDTVLSIPLPNSNLYDVMYQHSLKVQYVRQTLPLFTDERIVLVRRLALWERGWNN
jgi:hypothetical protein